MRESKETPIPDPEILDFVNEVETKVKNEVFFKCNVCFEGFSDERLCDEHILKLHLKSSFNSFEDNSTELTRTPKIENKNGPELFILKGAVGPKKNNRAFSLDYKLQVIQEAKKRSNRDIGKKHALKK